MVVCLVVLQLVEVLQRLEMLLNSKEQEDYSDNLSHNQGLVGYLEHLNSSQLEDFLVDKLLSNKVQQDLERPSSNL